MELINLFLLISSIVIAGASDFQQRTCIISDDSIRKVLAVKILMPSDLLKVAIKNLSSKSLSQQELRKRTTWIRELGEQLDSFIHKDMTTFNLVTAYQAASMFHVHDNSTYSLDCHAGPRSRQCDIDRHDPPTQRDPHELFSQTRVHDELRRRKRKSRHHRSLSRSSSLPASLNHISYRPILASITPSFSHHVTLWSRVASSIRRNPWTSAFSALSLGALTYSLYEIIDSHTLRNLPNAAAIDLLSNDLRGMVESVKEEHQRLILLNSNYTQEARDMFHEMENYLAASSSWTEEQDYLGNIALAHYVRVTAALSAMLHNRLPYPLVHPEQLAKVYQAQIPNWDSMEGLHDFIFPVVPIAINVTTATAFLSTAFPNPETMIYGRILSSEFKNRASVESSKRCLYLTPKSHLFFPRSGGLYQKSLAKVDITQCSDHENLLICPSSSLSRDPAVQHKYCF